MIEPKLGMTDQLPTSGIADALFPRVRQRVLSLLFGNPGRSFFSNEIISLVHSGSGAVQRELAGLAGAGLLMVTTQGNQKRYQANADAPVFDELRKLVLKTSGLVDVLRASLAPLRSRIDAAFVYGSVAKQQDTASSDVDLMIISDTVAYADLFAALESAGVQLGRKINPTIYTTAELSKRIQQRNSFVTRVLDQEKLWVLKNDEILREHST